MSMEKDFQKLVDGAMSCKFNKKCPIRIGFEIYFQGEKEEKEMRKSLLPLLKKLYDSGSRVLEGSHKEG